MRLPKLIFPHAVYYVDIPNNLKVDPTILNVPNEYLITTYVIPQMETETHINKPHRPFVQLFKNPVHAHPHTKLQTPQPHAIQQRPRRLRL